MQKKGDIGNMGRVIPSSDIGDAFALMWSLAFIRRLPSYVAVEIVPAMGPGNGEMRAVHATHLIHQAKTAWRIARSERDLHSKHSVPDNEFKFADAVAKAARSRWFPCPFTCDSVGDVELVETRKNVIC